MLQFVDANELPKGSGTNTVDLLGSLRLIPEVFLAVDSISGLNLGPEHRPQVRAARVLERGARRRRVLPGHPGVHLRLLGLGEQGDPEVAAAWVAVIAQVKNT